MVIYRREGRNKECACLMYGELKEKSQSPRDPPHQASFGSSRLFRLATMADIIPVTYEVFSCGTSRALALRMVRGIFSFPTYSGLLWLIPSSHRHSLLHFRGHVSAPEGGFRIPDPPLTQSRHLGRHFPTGNSRPHQGCKILCGAVVCSGSALCCVVSRRWPSLQGLVPGLFLALLAQMHIRSHLQRMFPRADHR